MSADRKPLDISGMKARCEKATNGPWAWVVNLQSRSIHLRSDRSGWEIVMDFVRWGMSGARPRLRNTGGRDLMENAETFAVEVEGREHHRSWYQALRHPDADFIASARTDLPLAIAEVERLRGLLGEALGYVCGSDYAEDYVAERAKVASLRAAITAALPEPGEAKR